MPAITRPKVVVRCRPLVTEVEKGDPTLCFECEDKEHISFTDENVVDKRMQFDRVFNPDDGNECVTQEMVPPALSAVSEGLCTTLIHFGQSGSGKTYTMENCIREPFLKGLFAIGKKEGITDFTVRISVVQVHLSKIQDLTMNQARTHDLVECKLKWDGAGHDISGNEWWRVNGTEEALSLIKKADAHRTSAATRLNTNSSRSHALVLIRPEWVSGGLTRSSRIALVDLAGSERVKESEVQGQALKEAIDINQGLANLGKVIRALVKKDRGLAPPFRENVLTQLLQGSMQQSWQTLLLCLSPAALYKKEGMRTLSFGNEMLQLKVRPRAQVNAKGAAQYERIIEEMQKEIENLTEDRDLLQQELEKEKTAVPVLKDITQAAPEGELEAAKEELEILRQEKAAMEKELEQKQREAEAIRSKMETAQKDLEAAKDDTDAVAKLKKQLEALEREREAALLGQRHMEELQKSLEHLKEVTEAQEKMMGELRDREQEALAGATVGSPTFMAKALRGHRMAELEENLRRELAEAIRSENKEDIARLTNELHQVREKLSNSEKKAHELEEKLREYQEMRTQHIERRGEMASPAVDKLKQVEQQYVAATSELADILEMQRTLTPEVPEVFRGDLGRALTAAQKNFKKITKEIGLATEKLAHQQESLFLSDAAPNEYGKCLEENIVTLEDPTKRLNDEKEKLERIVALSREIARKPLPPEDEERLGRALRVAVEAATSSDKSTATISPRTIQSTVAEKHKTELENLLREMPASAATLENYIGANPTCPSQFLALCGLRRTAPFLKERLLRFEASRMLSTLFSLSFECRLVAATEIAEELVQCVVAMLETEDSREANNINAMILVGAICEDCEKAKKLWVPHIGTMVDILSVSQNQHLQHVIMDGLSEMALGCKEVRDAITANEKILPTVASLLESTPPDVPRVLIAGGRLAGQLVVERASNTVTAAAQRLLPALSRVATFSDKEAKDSRICTVAATAIVKLIISGKSEVAPLVKEALSASELLEQRLIEAGGRTLLESTATTISLLHPPFLSAYGQRYDNEFHSECLGGVANGMIVRNPQYILTVTEPCIVSVCISDPHYRLRSKLDTRGTKKDLYLGLRIFEMPQVLAADGKPLVSTHGIENTFMTSSQKTDSNAVTMALTSGTYAVIPYNSNMLLSPFRIAACSNREIVFHPADMGEFVCTQYRKTITDPYPSKLFENLSSQLFYTAPTEAKEIPEIGVLGVTVNTVSGEKALEQSRSYSRNHSTKTVEELLADFNDHKKVVGPLFIAMSFHDEEALLSDQVQGFGTFSTNSYWELSAGQAAKFAVKAKGTGIISVRGNAPEKEENEKDRELISRPVDCTISVMHYRGAKVVPLTQWKYLFQHTGKTTKEDPLVVKLPPANGPCLVVVHAVKSHQHVLKFDGTNAAPSVTWRYTFDKTLTSYYKFGEGIPESGQKEAKVVPILEEAEGDTVTVAVLHCDDSCKHVAGTTVLPIEELALVSNAAFPQRETAEMLRKAMTRTTDVEAGEIVLLPNGRLFLVQDPESGKGISVKLKELSDKLVTVDLSQVASVFRVERDGHDKALLFQKEH